MRTPALLARALPAPLTALALWVGGMLPVAAAADEPLVERLKQLAERVDALEKRNAELEKALQTDHLSDKEPELATRLKATESDVQAIKPQARRIEALEGISVGASVTAAVQHAGARATASGSGETRSNYRGDVTLTLPGGSLGAAEGKFFTHLRFGQGTGIGLRPTYTSTPNSFAFETAAGPDDSFAILAQAWYQLTVPLPLDGVKAQSKQRLEINVGKIDPFVFFDGNAAADDESVRFMNNAFVHNPLLDSGGNTGADAYGFQPGARVAYIDDAAGWRASLGVFGSGTGANFSGSASRPFVIGQLETTVKPMLGRPGTYRLYAWTNGRTVDFDGTEARHSGWGLSFDQRAADDVMLFGRYGDQRKGRVRFDRALTLGAEITGNPWRRGADALGIAVGALHTSSAFGAGSATVDADGDGTPDFGYAASGSERIAELYYRFKINSALELTPDLQWIQRPGGERGAPSIKVVGLRAKFGF